MRNVTYWLTAFIGALLWFTPLAGQPTQQVVSNVDLNRYQGVWFEIARFDHWFERDLNRVTACYTLQDDGYIQVVNAGYKIDNPTKYKAVKGRARQAKGKPQGHLEVSFFLWFWSDYLILDLDQQNYQYALVGSPSRKYLWVLSRTPVLDADIYQKLVDKATRLGYNTSQLQMVNQSTPR